MPIDWFMFSGVNLLWTVIKNIIFIAHAHSLVTFSWVSYNIVTTRNVFFIFAYDTKEKEHKNTRQYDQYSRATSPSYKSDSQMFRCSFYYLCHIFKIFIRIHVYTMSCSCLDILPILCLDIYMICTLQKSCLINVTFYVVHVLNLRTMRL
jgi:hypothetical protein